MTVKVCNQIYADPVYCKNFDSDDEIGNCVHQMKKLKAGYVLIEGEKYLEWVKREDALKQGYGVPPNEFQLGLNKDGSGLDHPDWIHVHGNCLTILLKEEKID